MNTANRILILSGVTLIACTMAFGVGYAIFYEQQTLADIGMQMASGFVEAANGDLDASHRALDSYGALSQDYGNETHAHGHWGMLALILIVLGLAFDKLGLSQRKAVLLASVLAASAAAFPLGVLLQIGPAAELGKILSIAGSIGMVCGLFIVALSLLKPNYD